jgi:hypothetical protein
LLVATEFRQENSGNIKADTGLAIPEPCVILAHLNKGTFRFITEEQAGKPEAPAKPKSREGKRSSQKKILAARRRWRGPRAQWVTLPVLPFLFVHVFNGYVASLSATIK